MVGGIRILRHVQLHHPGGWLAGEVHGLVRVPLLLSLHSLLLSLLHLLLLCILGIPAGTPASMTKVEEVEAKWVRLVRDLEAIRARGEHCVLTGDLNKLVGDDALGVPGNSAEVSAGGRLLRGLLATGNWFLVNGMGEEVVEGGPWTRVDPATGGFSCLDMFVVNSQLRPHVGQLTIDSAREMTAARVVGPVGRARLVYSDHFSCLLTLNQLQRRQTKKTKVETKWNFARDGGWNRYNVLSNEVSEKIAKELEKEETSFEDKVRKFERIHEDIKYKAFGKVKLNNKQNEDNNTTENKVKANDMLEEQNKRTEEEINEIKRIGKSKVGKVWEIKRKIVGNKKATVEATAVINPKSGKLVVSRDEIKKVTLDYCKSTLENNKPEEEFNEKIELKKKSMKEKLDEDKSQFVITKDTFELVVNKFRKSNKRNYDFLVKSSPQFKEQVFKMCQQMIEHEKFPKTFNDTILHMIYKGKGKCEELSNNRFIHSKSWLPRLVEALVVEQGLKRPLVEESSIFQIGGQPGHRSEELLFAMKSIIAKQRKEGKAVVVQMWDISKFFDKEMIEDAVLTCLKRKTNIKATRVWFKLNENTRIKVKTGVGLSEPAEVGAVVGQGTIGGALVSQAVLDEGVMEHFSPGEEGEMQYGGVPLAPMMFMDDLIHSTRGVKEARRASCKVNILMKERALHLNQGKSTFIMYGTKRQKELMRAELEAEPMRCGDFIMEEKATDKWLGQMLSGEGLAESVAATVAAKEPKIKGACLEIARIAEDWRSTAAGGMETALVLWERCCIPSLLHGAGTWTKVSVATIQKLNKLQQWFIRLVLQVGPGAPVAALGWETGLMEMGLRVAKEKVIMVLHLRQLGEETLAGSVYKEQVARGWPGLAQEVKDICKDLKIEDANKTNLDKHEYKQLVELACMSKNENILRKLAENKNKCERIMKDPCGKKSYMMSENITEVRKYFKTRTRMLPFAANYPGDRRFARTSWLCGCGSREEEEHIMGGRCPLYSDLRGEYGEFREDEELVQFFAKVLDRREQLGELDREEQERIEVATSEATSVPASPQPGAGQLSNAC